MTIFEKLLEVQREIGAIKRDSTNPFFNSRYFDINGLLAAVKPVLTKHGLIVLQPLDAGGIRTMIIEAETEKDISFATPIPPTADAQKMGSAVTYLRRYALQSLLALEAEDDDGNHAAASKPSTTRRVVDTAKLAKSNGDLPF